MKDRQIERWSSQAQCQKRINQETAGKKKPGGLFALVAALFRAQPQKSLRKPFIPMSTRRFRKCAGLR